MSYAEAISVTECATVNDVTIGRERAEAAERNDQAQQEQQVIDAAEDVEEPIDDKPRRRLEPARVEPDDAGVAVELKRALDAA